MELNASAKTGGMTFGPKAESRFAAAPKAANTERSSIMKMTRPLPVSSHTERSGGSFKQNGNSLLKDTKPMGFVRQASHITPDTKSPALEKAITVPHEESKSTQAHRETGREIFELPKLHVQAEPKKKEATPEVKEHPILDTVPLYTREQPKMHTPVQKKTGEVRSRQEISTPSQLEHAAPVIAKPIHSALQEPHQETKTVLPRPVHPDISLLPKPVPDSQPEIHTMPTPVRKVVDQSIMPATRKPIERPQTETQTVKRLENFIAKQDEKKTDVEPKKKLGRVYAFIHSVETTMWVRALSHKKAMREDAFALKDVTKAISYIPGVKERQDEANDEAKLSRPDSLSIQLTGISRIQIFHAILDKEGRARITMALRIRVLRVSAGMDTKLADGMLEKDITEFFKDISVEKVMQEEDEPEIEESLLDEEEPEEEEPVDEEETTGYRGNRIEFDRERPVDTIRREILKDAIERMTIRDDLGTERVDGAGILHAIPDATEEKIQSTIVRKSKWYIRDGSYTAIQEQLASAGEMDPEKAADFIDQLIDMYPAVKITQLADAAVTDTDFERVVDQTPFEYK